MIAGNVWGYLGVSGPHPEPEIGLRFVLSRKSSFALKDLPKPPDSSNFSCGHLNTKEVLSFSRVSKEIGGGVQSPRGRGSTPMTSKPSDICLTP